MERSLKILLADDEEIVHQTIADYLSDSGHLINRVHNGISALEAIKCQDYDMALIDLRMPGMDGLSLLTNIREIRPDIPVVIITGYGEMEIALQALKLGATDFLPKPVRMLELDAVLEKSVRIRDCIAQHKQDTEAPRSIDGDPESVTIEELQATIAKRNYAEAILLESERRYHQVIENTTDVIWHMDTELRTTYVNPAVAELLGYDVDEVTRKKWENLAAPGQQKIIKGMFAEELTRQSTDEEDTHKMRIMRVQLVCKDGSHTWVEVKCIALRGSVRQPTGLLLMMHKSTEGKEMAKRQ